MAYDGAGTPSNRFNSAKQITELQDQRLIKELLDSFFLARHGYSPEQSMDEVAPNKRVENRVRGLYSVTQSLRDLILRGRGDIESDELLKWKKKNKNEDEANIKDFYTEENDFSRLNYQREIVKACEMDIREAERTTSKDDDFMIVKETNDGEIYELTDNYFEMIDELEDCWTEIEKILKRHEILAQQVNDDEEVTYKEQEELYLERFREA